MNNHPIYLHTHLTFSWQKNKKNKQQVAASSRSAEVTLPKQSFGNLHHCVRK